MQRGWELETGGSRLRKEMVGGDFLSRPRPHMGCSAREWVSECTHAHFILFYAFMFRGLEIFYILVNMIINIRLITDPALIL